MTSHGHEDADEARRKYQAPYTSHHPIPTVSKYREEKAARQAEAEREDLAGSDAADKSHSRTERAKEGWRTYRNRDEKEQDDKNTDQIDVDGDGDVDQDDQDEAEAIKDTSEATPIADPRKRKKGLGKKKERAEREVTDPVTHLPVRIYDFTEDSLKNVDENPVPFGQSGRTATGLSNKGKSGRELHDEHQEMQQGLESMNALFPPPDFDAIREDLASINKTGITLGIAGTACIIGTAFLLVNAIRPHIERMVGSEHGHTWLGGVGFMLVVGLLSVGGLVYLIAGVRAWMANRFNDTWEDHVWEANLQSQKRTAKAHETESVSWLNSLLGAVWPLINPDLFTSLADTLEDVMQASLPSLVQMVSVEDIGQGSQNLRILGIRWLPTGAAARSVGSDGKLESAKQNKHDNDREVPGQGEVDQSAKSRDDAKDNGKSKDEGNQDQSEDSAANTEMTEGMEGEEGDFINLEVAFAYRSRSSKSFKEQTKNMHLYLAFYLPGTIKLPVWVSVNGVVGTCRLRLQLTPDPPFFGLCTLTFLGQPKVDIGCIPLIKRGLNIMDLPLISNFVRGSVDAAMAEYVAPRSLTLDLKDMLAGDDFKKDTNARGIIVVDIKRGYDFKMGDASIPILSDGSSDPYVSVGWAKFGKALFSTRVLVSEMEPEWHERTVLLVTPEELNVDERLRLQLWDSDRFTADDDLGRIEVDLKEIMRSDATNGQMSNRSDGFRALKAGEDMPGQLDWSVGYFSKTRLQPCQFKAQQFDSDIRSREDLEKKVEDTCRRKLREAMIKKGRHAKEAGEFDQLKDQERADFENAITISAPPPDDYPSGIFSLQIHQITGLELQKLSKSETDKHANTEDIEEQSETLPSAYCNVIINHRKVFKTRTKPKNSKPFYNAGTERFIPDWRDAEVYVAVRDAREGEEDPLLGIVHLPLGEVFKKQAQVNGFYPITGGVGYGRVRISMVWRSVQLQAPQESLGWDLGTVEVQPTVSSSDLPSDLQALSIKFHTSLGAGKMKSQHGEGEATWKTRRGHSLHLPVQKRYATSLAIRFKRHGMIKDKTAAFAVLWLKDIPDEEEKELTLPVYTGNYERARSCCLDEPGEKVGSIKFKLTFWSGLGAVHQKWASQDENIKNVMEVLDVARDNYESKKSEEAAGIVDKHADDSSSDSDEADSSEDEDDGRKSKEATATAADRPSGPAGEGAGGSKGGTTNLIDQARDYKKHASQKHRQHRGVMQYKVPRTANWAANKAEKVGQKIEGLFSRHTREAGIETEV